MKVLLTGTNGFVGRRLHGALVADKYDVRCAVRCGAGPDNSVEVGDIGPETAWSPHLAGIDTVVHLAARAHVMNDSAADPLAEFRRVNVDGTLHLARQAAAAGVRRFVFISTVKVNGEQTGPNRPFTESDQPNPEDPYGLSKLEAEQGLGDIARQTGMEVVVIRPPLVYGPGVKGNFRSMVGWIGKGIPLPLGAIRNRRSLVGLDNLVDFILTCIEHPAAANQTFLVSDGEDLSTSDLLRRVGEAMGRPARLLGFPSALLVSGAKLLGKGAVARRLCGNLQVDISKAKTLLGWVPPVSVDEGLRRSVADLAEVRKGGSALSIRLLDIVLSLAGLALGWPLLAVLYVVGLFDTGSPLFLQERVGRNRQPFTLVKFRTMTRDTASVASHLASSSSITTFGHFLRRTKLDELPQLWNVLKGEMSLVGPRPCLFNQEELIGEREKRGVFNVRPGITGLAQVNGIDMSTPELLAETDAKMIENISLSRYFSYIIQTAVGKGSGDRVVK